MGDGTIQNWPAPHLVKNAIGAGNAIVINNGANSTSSAAVTLQLFSSDETSGVAFMKFGNDGTTWTDPEPYATARAWTLSPGEGAKTVYAMFQDAAGNWSPASSASIILNTALTITASAGVNGTISPSGVVEVVSGATATFTVTPNTGYHVSDVLVDGASVGAVSSYTFTNVAANHTITAGFTINTYTITASAGAYGTISPLGVVSVASGTTATFIVMPNMGYHVSDVLVDGASVGAVSSYTFTNVTANHAITASFAINSHTITASAGVNGTISPSGVVEVVSGATATFAVTPNAGYHISDVLVDGASVGAIDSCTFTNVTTDHTITASFAINTFTITAVADANGAVSPTGAVSVNYGDTVTFNVTPNTNFIILDVFVDGVSVGAVGSYTFTNITANHSISASFTVSSGNDDTNPYCLGQAAYLVGPSNFTNGISVPTAANGIALASPTDGAIINSAKLIVKGAMDTTVPVNSVMVLVTGASGTAPLHSPGERQLLRS